MQITKTVETSTLGEVTQETKVFAPAFYDKLKVIVQIWLPAFSALYLSIGQIWGLPEPEKVVASVAALTAFLGVLVGISSKRYADSDAPHDGEMIVAVDGGGAVGYTLQLNGNPELLANQKSVSFKVVEQPTYNPAP